MDWRMTSLKTERPLIDHGISNSEHIGGRLPTGDRFMTNQGSVMTGSLLSVEEVAELLQVPRSWVYERTRNRGNNRIPGFRLGKYWRFRAEDIFAWLERQRSGGRAHA